MTMAILAAGQRRFLFDRHLRYLFSYDVPLCEELRMRVPGGMSLGLGVADHGAAVAPPPSPPASGAGRPRDVPRERRGGDDFAPREVYHVFDEEAVEDNDAVAGTVSENRDLAFVPDEGEVGSLEGSIVICTRDGALIDARYTGSLALGPRASRVLEPPRSGGAHARLRAFIAPRFETAHPKYKWLTEHQCAAFGVLIAASGELVRATFDVYAMTSAPP